MLTIVLMAACVRFNMREDALRELEIGAAAQITPERLVEHLRLSGFVVMQRPPAALAPGRQYGGGFRAD